MVAALWVFVANFFGCDPEDAYFIEPRDSLSNSSYFVVPAGDSQAANAARLGVVAGDVESVRYRLLPRHAPFLLQGDLGAGTGLEAVQLPALGGTDYERIVPVPNSGWSSLRVYDRGLCSILVTWDDGPVGSMTNQLFGAILREFSGTSGVIGGQLKWGTLTPRLGTNVPRDPISSPDARDALLLNFELNAVSLDGPAGVIRCNDAVARVSLEMELEASDLAWVELRARDGGRRGSDRNFAAQCLGDRRAPIERVRQAVEERACLAGAEFDLPNFGLVSAEEIADFRMRADYSGDAGDQHVLLGIATVRGRAVAAHDTLVRVRSLDVELEAKCIQSRRERIRDMLVDTFRQAFVTGLSAGFRDALVLDPVHVTQPDEEPQFIQCNSDQDCSALNDAPAFALPEGRWRGVRHRCLKRDPDRYPDALSIFVRPSRDEEFYCHPVIEPDHVNVRPDGLQLVVSTAESDPQQSMLTSTPAGFAFCSEVESLRELRGHLGAEEPLRAHVDRSPFEYTGPRISDGVVVGGCSAGGAGSSAWAGFVVWLFLRRRR
jgi:hypothetical protein